MGVVRRFGGSPCRSRGGAPLESPGDEVPQNPRR